MQGPQLCAKSHHFVKLNVATSRIAFLDLNLHVLQVTTPNSNNRGRSVVQNCTSDTPNEYIWYLAFYFIKFSNEILNFVIQKSISSPEIEEAKGEIEGKNAINFFPLCLSFSLHICVKVISEGGFIFSAIIFS